MRYRQYISKKEQSNLKLSKQLRLKGKITTLSEPFKESMKVEINTLITSRVFEFVKYRLQLYRNTCIFSLRLVNKIKGKNTKPYKKSQLVIQGFNNEEKRSILTESPTIQRASQRLITSIALSLLRDRINLYLCDIT